MDLKTQILSLIFSFVFGILFSIGTNLNYRFIFCKRKLFQIIITFIYIIDATLLYFLILKKINEGVIHSYFLFATAIGFFLGFVKLSNYINLVKKKVKKCVKMSNKQKKK